MTDHDDVDARTAPVRSVLADAALLLISCGAHQLGEHPDEAASDPDILTLLSAGCRYLREHPEARMGHLTHRAGTE